LKAQVANSIVAALHERHLTVRAGAAAAGIDPADVQRIRNADLARFTLDRLIRVARRLGHRVEIVVLPRLFQDAERAKPEPAGAALPRAAPRTREAGS